MAELASLRNKIYYRVKPFVPSFVRRNVRRRFALRLRAQTRNTWPIMPGSERPPTGWPGWPDGKDFAFVLTHDVEGKAGLDKCRQLMQLEVKHGFRSSFNFIPEGEYRVPRELLEELTAGGFEIGVHDLHHDGRLYQSRREFHEKAARINHYVREWGASGFRSGFMLHNLDWLHDLEIAYDASTFDTDPFEPQPEGGHTIYPFWIPNPHTKSTPNGSSVSGRGGYVEMPYTLPQDSTLFLLLREATIEIWEDKIDWIARHGGMALLDTHPDYMAFDGRRPGPTEYPIELYEKFLVSVRSKYEGRYWHALPREVAGYAFQNRLTLPPSSYSAGSSEAIGRLRGRRGAVLLFSHYPADPRPRRAAEALAEEGVSIDVICLRNGTNEVLNERFGNIRVSRVPLQRRRAGKLSYALQYAAFLLSSFVKLTVRSFGRKYDFVHVHNMPDVLVFSALVPKLLGAKVILDLHDPMPELMQTIFKLPEQSSEVRMLKRLEKWSVGFADLVLTVNEACKKIYSSRSCPPEKVSVVLNSPDENIFPLRAIETNHRNGATPSPAYEIMYHGSLVHRNGFDLAVDALEKVRHSIPSVRLTVCGERTPYFDTVMESACARGVDKNISYLGAQNLDQIVEVIKNCDLGIIPNHRNIFTELNTPTRIFEYLALGKPVIAPKAPGIQDYFGEKDLLFFELGDSHDLAARIEFAFANPREALETARRGQEIYRAHTWKRERETLLAAMGGLF